MKIGIPYKQKFNQVISLAPMRGDVDGSGKRSNSGGGAGDRRRQILEAAGRALAEVGFEEITTRRIAREAGVNIATLHYHFGSKEALLTEALRHALSQAEGYLREAMGAAATPAGALEAGFETIGEIARERPGMLRYDLVLRALRHEGARAEAQAVYATYRGMVEELVERHKAGGGTLAPGVTGATLAHYAVTAVDGILLQHLITGDDAATKSSLDLVRRHALSLLNAGEGRDGTNHE